MGLELYFLEKGVAEEQWLGDVMPGNYATFLDIAPADPVVLAVVCLQKALRRPEGVSYGQVFAGDTSFLLGIPPGGLGSSNRLGYIGEWGYWHREVVSGERETGLLLVKHIPDDLSEC